MSEIDEVKELIGYLKVVFALVLATTIGLKGVVKMEMVVVITVTFFIGALVYMVGQALRH